jgi:hypothetical protein
MEDDIVKNIKNVNLGRLRKKRPRLSLGQAPARRVNPVFSGGTGLNLSPLKHNRRNDEGCSAA